MVEGLIIDPKTLEFSFERKDLETNATYIVQYLRMNGITETIGVGKTNSKGTLCIKGDYRAPVEDFTSEYPPVFDIICVDKTKEELEEIKKVAKKEAKADKKEAKAEAKEEKKEAKEDKKEAKLDSEQEKKDSRADFEQEKKDVKSEAKQEKEETKRDEKQKEKKEEMKEAKKEEKKEEKKVKKEEAAGAKEVKEVKEDRKTWYQNYGERTKSSR